MRGDVAVTDDDDDDMQEMHCATSTPAVTSPCALAAAAVWERGEESMYVRAQNACACVSAAAAAEHELANRHTHTDTHMHTSLFLSVCLAMLCCAVLPPSTSAGGVASSLVKTFSTSQRSRLRATPAISLS